VILTPWRDDARQALRWVRHHPGLSLVVIGTLGAATAAVIAAFAIAEAALINPLPDSNPGQLVIRVPFVYETDVRDVRVLVGAAALMLAVSVVAASGSAREAARTDAVEALRAE
jgi:hypothetical protein